MAGLLGSFRDYRSLPRMDSFVVLVCRYTRITLSAISKRECLDVVIQAERPSRMGRVAPVPGNANQCRLLGDNNCSSPALTDEFNSQGPTLLARFESKETGLLAPPRISIQQVVLWHQDCGQSTGTVLMTRATAFEGEWCWWC